MWVKVFSPTVSGIELVKRAEKKIRRARLFYMRYLFSLFSLLRFERERNLLTHPPLPSCTENPNTTAAASKASSSNISKPDA